MKVRIEMYDDSNHKVAFSVREAFKNYIADFSVKGGGYPLFPLRFFGHNDFLLRGGSTPQFR